MSVPPEHERVLPAVAISEEGLRQLELWLKERLAVPAPTPPATTGGDYVYIGHITADEDEPIEIDVTALSEAAGGGFSHLVVEALLYQDMGEVGDALDTLWIQWGADLDSIVGDGYWSGVMRFYSTDNPTAAEAVFSHVAPEGDFPDEAVIIPDFVAPTRDSATSLTLKFPRYHNYFLAHPSVQIQGVTINKTPDDGIGRAIVYGAGGNIDYTDAIGGIKIASPDNFHSNSRVEIYGIRGETFFGD